MEARDSAHALGLQMQAFYEHYRAGGGAFPPYQPSPLQQQQQQPSPHQQQQQQQHQHYLHHQHHLLHQQQQQQQQQQPQHQQPQHQQHNPPIIHSPAPLRQMNPNLNPNPNPSLVTNLNPNSTSGVSACYPPETPPHMIPHQLQAASSSPPSGVGMSMSPGSAMVSRSAPAFKKKRGRPRKYDTDGNGAAALVMPLNSAPPAVKKGGRGPSKKAQISTSGTTGQGFTPHVLTVGAGEDITAKIMTFSQHGPWAVCILSANGAISNASLWHSGISSGTVTYEGRFEILSLSGLFLLTEDGATQSRSGGFSVSLAGQDGRVIGGRVAGLLIAATPIQVVVGTFFPENRKSQARAVNVDGPSPTPPPGGSQQASMPMMDRTQNDASGPVQDHVPAGSVKEVYGASHEMPLQSADWGFDAETRSHSEQI